MLSAQHDSSSLQLLVYSASKCPVTLPLRVCKVFVTTINSLLDDLQVCSTRRANALHDRAPRHARPYYIASDSPVFSTVNHNIAKPYHNDFYMPVFSGRYDTSRLMQCTPSNISRSHAFSILAT